jgi:glycine betaine/proline transport system substrate-binding protein
MPGTIRLGHIALSFHQAAAAVVALVLERAGHVVEMSSAPHAELFERLGRGEIDMLCSAWLPASHGVYLAPFEDNVVKLGVLYEPYCIWGVPDYVPAEAVATVDDLKKPDVAARMRKVIQGINPGAGISRFSQRMVEEYGLAALGYHFQSGTEADCFGTFEEAVANREWLIVPLWHPQWLHHRYRIRPLEEPKALLGGVDQATLVMSHGLLNTMNPDLVQRLKTLTLGNAAVTALDHAICREGKHARKAALAMFSSLRMAPP